MKRAARENSIVIRDIHKLSCIEFNSIALMRLQMVDVKAQNIYQWADISDQVIS